MYVPAWKEDGGSECTMGEQLCTEQRGQLEMLLQKYQDEFKSKPGWTKAIKHFIHTADRLVKQHPYQLPHAYWEKVEQELREICYGVIEPSQSDWESPIVLIRKKDGSIHLWVDYRKLNTQSRTDAYPMPRIEDILDWVGKAKFITTLDLTHGYWQVPIAEEDRHKTAFITSPFGLYQFCVMPFRLNGAPATFQRLMNKVVQDMKKFTHAYLDDLIVFGDSWTEQLGHLKTILEKLWEFGLTAKLAKCQWAMAECTYLDGGYVKPEINKLEAMENFPIPKTKKEVRSFFRFTGYYRCFIKEHVSMTVSLTNLTQRL